MLWPRGLREATRLSAHGRLTTDAAATHGHVSRSVDDHTARASDGSAGSSKISPTPDHGGLDGDGGLLLIGPALVDSVTRCTLLWKPAPSRNVAPADVNAPLGLMDIPATVCEIAGVEVPEWMEGRPLPVSEDDDAAAQGRDRVRVLWAVLHPMPEPGALI
jgi:hypothetical protein